MWLLLNTAFPTLRPARDANHASLCRCIPEVIPNSLLQDKTSTVFTHILNALAPHRAPQPDHPWQRYGGLCSKVDAILPPRPGICAYSSVLCLRKIATAMRFPFWGPLTHWFSMLYSCLHLKSVHLEETMTKLHPAALPNLKAWQSHKGSQKSSQLDMNKLGGEGLYCAVHLIPEEQENVAGRGVADLQVPQ